MRQPENLMTWQRHHLFSGCRCCVKQPETPPQQYWKTRARLASKP
ncbi:hypothetical protein GCWU000324_00674 [Kingella oralis ATCC 51147]|uniref:Uncharacterized protein n=1 Tax=Kingella oralis ATCC 51147 TaxID=629741 RepID=C4GEW5_9NEIS|nr:hypothetical protein GCWU000324_00674 [Kingella oralis ATCC 51147]